MDSGDSGATSPLTEVSVDADDPVYFAIVRCVAAVANQPIGELPPLGDAIDPESLDALVSQQAFDGAVTFEYADHVVRIESGDRVAVYADDPFENSSEDSA